MKNLAFLLCLILLTGGCKYFRKSTPKSVNIVTTDTDSVTDSYDTSAYYGASDANISTDEQYTIPTSTSTNAIAGNYYMIVGCFTVDANADRYVDKIKGLGYDAQIIPGVNNFKMVSAGTYNNYRESVAELDKFRSEVTPNAWVFKQK